MQRYALGLAWLSVGAAVAGFFLPWARLEVREPKLPEGLGRVTVSIRQGTKTIATDLRSLTDIPTQVSGAQIPQVANQEQAQVAIAVMELLTRRRQALGAKSYAVYLLPGLALVCGVLLACTSRSRAAAVGIGITCLGVAGLGFWKLLTAETTSPLVAVTFCRGLWLSLWAYVGLAVGAALAARQSP